MTRIVCEITLAEDLNDNDESVLLRRLGEALDTTLGHARLDRVFDEGWTAKWTLNPDEQEETRYPSQWQREYELHAAQLALLEAQAQEALSHRFGCPIPPHDPRSLQVDAAHAQAHLLEALNGRYASSLPGDTDTLNTIRDSIAAMGQIVKGAS